MGFFPCRGKNSIFTVDVDPQFDFIFKFGTAVRLYNSGLGFCYVRIGLNASENPASAADTPILPGTTLILHKAHDADVVSFVSDGEGITTLHVQPGRVSDVAFYAHKGTNQVVTPAAASATISLNPIDKTVRCVNNGANICYVRIGDAASGAPATTADTPVPPLGEVVLRKGDGENTLSYISALGTTLQVQTGEEY